jgi:serine/threonine-protein kinase
MGTVLYRTLAGQLPFPGATVQVVLHNVVYVDPPPLDTLDLGVPSSVASVVAVALRKRPEERYASMEALARAFLDAAHEPGSADGPRASLLSTDPGAPPAPDEQLSLSPLWRDRPQEVEGTEILPLEPSAAASAGSDDLPMGVYPAVEPAPGSAPLPPETQRLPDEPVRRRGVAARVTALGVVGLVVVVISAVGVWLGLHVSAERWGRSAGTRDAGAVSRAVTAPLDSASPMELPRGMDRGARDAGSARDAARHRVRLKKRAVASPARLFVVTQIDKKLAWSYLYVDGKMRGQTALRVTLSPGSHTVEVRRPGYRSQSSLVVLRSGQERTLRLELKR